MTNGLQKELSRRVARDKPDEPSYSEDEMKVRRDHATRIFRKAEERICGSVEHLALFRAGHFAVGSDDYLVGEALESVMASGEVPHYRAKRGNRYVKSKYRGPLGNRSGVEGWNRLFLTSTERIAAVFLLMNENGWNWSSVVALNLPTSVSAGEGSVMHLVKLRKPKRGGRDSYEDRSLDDFGPGSPGRLLSRIMTVTEPARDFAKTAGVPTNRLFVSRTSALREGSNLSEFVRIGVDEGDLVAWKNSGAPSINWRRVRKTVNTRYLRRPNQNTQNTHDSQYALGDPNLHVEMERVIAAGLAKALDHAKATIRAAVDLDGRPDLPSTPTAHCGEGTLKSPFAALGEPCLVSFLLCLACPLAVVTTSHIPFLAYLHECLGALRTSMLTESWNRRWRDSFERLDDLRENYVYEPSWRLALQKVTADERTTAVLLIQGQIAA
ncbi:hypothetical protein [Frondihabitans cladoniiphilus]|uniref:hypothetical protein n=1 Tax=Frondihabitans cladoniiphilus TaxID=715785 RepID=UPI0031F06E0C